MPNCVRKQGSRRGIADRVWQQEPATPIVHRICNIHEHSRCLRWLGRSNASACGLKCCCSMPAMEPSPIKFAVSDDVPWSMQIPGERLLNKSSNTSTWDSLATAWMNAKTFGAPPIRRGPKTTETHWCSLKHRLASSSASVIF